MLKPAWENGTMKTRICVFLSLACVALAPRGSSRAIAMDLVAVGHPGNPGELSGEGAGGFGPSAGPETPVDQDDAQIIIDIEALIDGRDLLVIKQNMMQWHQKTFAMVGHYDGYNETTIISTVQDGSRLMHRREWMPRWPERASVRQEAVSSTFLGLVPMLPRAEMKVRLTPLKCRGHARILQHPSAENDYALIVEFDDSQPPGFDWYKLRITIHEIGLPGSKLSGKPTVDRPVTLPDGFIAPRPYKSFNDSPFKDLSFKWFHLEDCEDGRVNTPGVGVIGGGVDPPHQLNDNNNDSVDGDDGNVDGLGRRARGYYAAGNRKITCKFDQRKLGGRFPSHAGIVWTDAVHVDQGKEGYGDVFFEAFDGDGCSLGKIGPVRLGDGRSDGMTEEDRFFGAVCLDGISAITISMPACGDWEVDHFQYGLQHDESSQSGVREKKTVALFDDVVHAVRRNWTAEFAETFTALEPVATIPLLAAVCGKPFGDVPDRYVNIQTTASSATIDKLPGGSASCQVCIDVPVKEGDRALLRFRIGRMDTQHVDTYFSTDHE